jgi:hypothetical protein
MAIASSTYRLLVQSLSGTPYVLFGLFPRLCLISLFSGSQCHDHSTHPSSASGTDVTILDAINERDSMRLEGFVRLSVAEAEPTHGAYIWIWQRLGDFHRY